MSPRIIRADGTETLLDKSPSMDDIRKLIGAESLDTVNLHHLGYPLQVMVVDDHAYEVETIQHGPAHFEMRPTKARKPINRKATALYHANCRPGTTHQIAGDVVIVFDEDPVDTRDDEPAPSESPARYDSAPLASAPPALAAVEAKAEPDVFVSGGGGDFGGAGASSTWEAPAPAAAASSYSSDSSDSGSSSSGGDSGGGGGGGSD